MMRPGVSCFVAHGCLLGVCRSSRGRRSPGWSVVPSSTRPTAVAPNFVVRVDADKFLLPLHNAVFGRTEAARRARAARRRDGGRGSTLVVTGEPVSARRRLARHRLAAEAEARGARVAFGRAWEVGGAPAFWPWSQALGELGLDLDELLGSASGGMASAQAPRRIRPRLRAVCPVDASPVVPSSTISTPPTSRASSSRWRSLVRHRAGGALLVVTSRESELHQRRELGELVGKLTREGSPFPSDASMRTTPQAGSQRRLPRRRLGGPPPQRGNPLFIEEPCASAWIASRPRRPRACRYPHRAPRRGSPPRHGRSSPSRRSSAGGVARRRWRLSVSARSTRSPPPRARGSSPECFRPWDVDAHESRAHFSHVLRCATRSMRRSRLPGARPCTPAAADSSKREAARRARRPAPARRGRDRDAERVARTVCSAAGVAGSRGTPRTRRRDDRERARTARRAPRRGHDAPARSRRGPTRPLRTATLGRGTRRARRLWARAKRSSGSRWTRRAALSYGRGGPHRRVDR